MPSNQFERPIFNFETYYDEVISVPNEDLPIYIFKNVRINPWAKNTKHYEMPGYWMCLTDGGRQYGHWLKESVGGFVYCQSIFKDLKPFFLETFSGKDNYTFHPMSELIEFAHGKIMQDFGDHDIYMMGNEIHHASFFIENLVIMMDNQRVFFNGEFPFFAEAHCPQVSKSLANYFKDYKIDDEHLPKKIFMSRKNVTKELKRTGMNENQYFKNRYFEEWVEDAIEKAFVDKGYAVVNWSGRPLQDQIRISHNATHMAGIIGTAFHNAIWSQNGTKFYAIRPNTNYLFDWEHDIVRSLENVIYKNVDPWDCKDYQEMYDFIYNSIDDES
jgi:hypothetical protein